MCLRKYAGLTLLLADDHPLFLKGLKNVIKSFGFTGKVLEAGNGREVVDFHVTHSIDLFMLDYSMPELTGFDAAKLILRLNPKAKIILITMYNEPPLIANFYKAGISGYIDKNSEPDKINAAINHVLKGWGFFNSLEDQGVKLNIDKCSPVEFTNREKDVIQLLAKGYRTHDIAEKLDLTYKTIETYRCRLLEKVNVKNTSELLDFVHRNGLI